MTIAPPEGPATKRPAIRRGRWLVLGLMVGVGAWWFLTHSKTVKPPQDETVLVRTAPVVQGAVPLRIEAVGTVVATQSVALRARLDSQITAVHFRDGDAVKAGDILFELDDKSLKAQAEQLAANITRDEAQLENARRQYGRTQTLAAKGFATKAGRDDARALQDAAAATATASRAALDNIKVLLSYTRIIAPISGRTGTINVTLGNTVKANDTTPLVTINQVTPIRVQAALPQGLLGPIREAMKKGSIAVQAYKQGSTASDTPIATGQLDYVDNGVDQSTGTFATRAGFPNEDEQLWPGMFVTLAMTLGEDAQAISIPEVAVQHGQAGDYVFVIAGNKAARRDINVARLQENIAVIESGLTAGEQVATDGLLALRDGVAVKIDSSSAATP